MIRSADAKPHSAGNPQLLHLTLIKSGKSLLAASNSSEDKRMLHAPLDRSLHSGTDRYIPEIVSVADGSGLDELGEVGGILSNGTGASL